MDDNTDLTGCFRPTILVTMGDPAGIGPEIALKSLNESSIYQICKPVIIGDLNTLQECAKTLKECCVFKPITEIDAVQGIHGVIEVIDMENVDTTQVKAGRISAAAGKAALEYIRKAVEAAKKQQIDAIVTAPIHKKAIHLAGSSYIGHTEMIADLANVQDPLTMFWVRGARIFFLSRHLSLSEAIKHVTRANIVNTTSQIDNALKKIGIPHPRIAIAALNPHAGDQQLFGLEEAIEITPAINQLQAKGIRAYGPIAADSVFHQTVEGHFDAVLSLYHDQGHIAAKTLDFHGTISVTLGLPFIRTSVDHGTAYDIAGQNIANPQSLIEAIKVAAKHVILQKLHYPTHETRL
jgi:4-hydroxythreonine-4-phosphate dehydrogenase